MHIKKIISGGQTGVDRAALDFAIEGGIPYGGWVSKGRKAEDGFVPDKYDRLTEMRTTSYSAGTEKNILESQGTLIVSHGKLTGVYLRTKQVATKHKRPFLSLDLSKQTLDIAAAKVINWLTAYDIEILNVAGARAGKDPEIYEATLNLLRTVFTGPPLPRTMEEAVERLIAELSLRSRSIIGRMTGDELITLNPELGQHIGNKFELRSGNPDLLSSCRETAGNLNLDQSGASLLIVEKLWERLKATHSLKLVAEGKSEE